MSFIFDGVEKVVQIGDGITSITIQDMYNRWKDWVVADNNAVFEQAFRFVGGDPLPGSKKLGTTYFIMNGWKIRPYSGNHTLSIDGNLYSEDGSSPYITALGSYNVMIINSVSSLVDSTVQQLPEIEYASYNGGITLDPILGTDSSIYPYGTPARPCKTLMNVDEISRARGFNKVFVYGDLVIDSIPDGFIFDMFIYGMRGYRVDTITVNDTLIDNCVVENMTVTGNCKIGSHVQFKDCNIDNLLNVHMYAERCRLKSGSYSDADLIKCVVDGDIILEENATFSGIDIVFEGDFTNIDLQGTPSTVSLDVDSGYVLIMNSVSGCLAEFNLRGGEIELDSSCTGGEFYAEGYGTLYGTPESLGIVTKANHLIALETIATTNWNYDITTATDASTISGYIKNKVLSVSKFIGLS